MSKPEDLLMSAIHRKCQRRLAHGKSASLSFSEIETLARTKKVGGLTYPQAEELVLFLRKKGQLLVINGRFYTRVRIEDLERQMRTYVPSKKREPLTPPDQRQPPLIV